MRGLGASQAEVEIFESRLQEFKTLLLKLYRQKTRLIAEREALRYKYVAGLKTRLNNLIGAILSQTYIDDRANAHGVLEIIFRDMTASIPMASVSGGPVKEYGRNPPMSNYNFADGFLSPMSAILTNPWFNPESEDKRPLYKVFLESWQDYYKPSDVMDREFLRWFRKVVDSDGQYIEFSWPFSKDWLLRYLMGSHSNAAANMAEEHGYITSLMTRTFPEYGGSLVGTMKEIEESLKKLLEVTTEAMRLQGNIDDVESDLAMFVAEFGDYAASIGLNVSDILRDLQAASEESDQPGEITQAALTEPAKKGSKWPWLVAAAVGIMVVTKEK